MKKEDVLRKKKEDALREKLHDFVDRADIKKLQALDELIGDFVDPGKWWENKEFMNEMKQAWKDYVNGGEVYTHEQVMEMLKKSINDVKKR